MCEFGITHLLNFPLKTEEEKLKWWLGRLVKVRITTNTMFINFPSKDNIGIVTTFQTTAIGDHIKVYFPAFEKSSWLMVNDVLTQEDKK
tara:strand:- start:365 stop:631 length:267 start_codon:yes stop_codon:yes gene_type:complete